MRKSFSISKDFLKVVEPLSNTQAGVLILNILKWVNDDLDLDEMDHETNIAFRIFMEDFKLNNPPIYVYGIIFTSETETFTKIGVAKNINKRIQSFKSFGYQCELFYKDGFETREDALNEEFSLHKRFEDVNYIPNVKFGGFTECFDLSVINKLSR
tara:strand:- start:1582 stop:2049 length:468 start_codon:yes stop_codon:yes gene_type:complete